MASAVIDKHKPRDWDEKPDEPIRIPDLFVSFLCQEPKPHPSHEKVKKASEDWFADVLHLSKTQRSKHWDYDLPYFVSVWMKHASEESYKIVSDWDNWVFCFDDLFDDDDLERNDTDRAAKEVEVVLNITKGKHDPKDDVHEGVMISALRYMYCDVWERIVQNSTPVIQQRVAEAMEYYLQGILNCVRVEAGDIERDLEKLIEFRRGGIGVEPCIALAEFAGKLNVPEKFFRSSVAQELRNCTTDLVFLQNDIISYHREHDMGVTHNLISFLRSEGYTQQQAYDKMDEMLRERYKMWYRILSEIPIYDE
ncbi:isoprenoid synthase domain-containing protein [Aspergillus avenaceus]|uniref:Terpene synthase n=1 Tax=Aspergillus avenaceus TaxID=36643 RepID=A0A5N6TP11_ASPAV|nr:isoprenoid synthase domain-containing protein [Aspergillus avenaceus]